MMRKDVEPGRHRPSRAYIPGHADRRQDRDDRRATTRSRSSASRPSYTVSVMVLRPEAGRTSAASVAARAAASGTAHDPPRQPWRRSCRPTQVRNNTRSRRPTPAVARRHRRRRPATSRRHAPQAGAAPAPARPPAARRPTERHPAPGSTPDAGRAGARGDGGDGGDAGGGGGGGGGPAAAAPAATAAAAAATAAERLSRAGGGPPRRRGRRRPGRRRRRCAAPMTLPMSFMPDGPGAGDDVGDDRGQVGVLELGRQVAGQHLALGLLPLRPARRGRPTRTPRRPPAASSPRGAARPAPRRR